jgi:hypothetical protein
MTQSQTKKIRKHLENGESISPLDALYNYGCFRLAARIYDLKEEGMNIEKYTDYLSPDKNKLITFYKLAS